ncbi:MAG: NAD(P)/FAD-dependent oxidoreductase [Candidatus Odinarchaeia archaeon]
MKEVELAVIGGGPAGLSAALSALNNGVKNILIIERNKYLGGILIQCIHEGFGIDIFNEALTGPEYAHRFIDLVTKKSIEVMLNSTVLSLSKDKELIVANKEGLFKVNAKAVILAMGCRERTIGNINIAGTRPSGVYTAGTAQSLINLRNFMVGTNVVILGSGDIGLIMARRLTLEGAKVIAVIEIMPYPTGLPRNIADCLEYYNIPLILKHTIVEIKGKKRLESVVIAEVDENFKPISGTEKEIKCDTLILSVGLIPENELSVNAGIKIDPCTGGPIVNNFLETTIRGIFACGNVLHVHTLVDDVSREAELAGKSAAEYIKKGYVGGDVELPVVKTKNIRYVVPQKICPGTSAVFYVKTSGPVNKGTLLLKGDEKLIKRLKLINIQPADLIKIQLNEKESKNVKHTLSFEAEEYG